MNRLAVLLHVPMSRIRWIDPGRVDLSEGYPAVGSLLYFDGVLSPGSVTEQTAALRPSVPTVVGNVRVIPIVVDEARQVWIERIEAAPLIRPCPLARIHWAGPPTGSGCVCRFRETRPARTCAAVKVSLPTTEW